MPQPTCGTATSAANATSLPGGSIPCRDRRRSTRSAESTAPTASSSRRLTTISASSSACSTRSHATIAGRWWRAPTSPRKPARFIRCWRTRLAASTRPPQRPLLLLAAAAEDQAARIAVEILHRRIDRAQRAVQIGTDQFDVLVGDVDQAVDVGRELFRALVEVIAQRFICLEGIAGGRQRVGDL